MYPDELYHYGIKGMKWGVRKARESGNSKALGRQFRRAQKKLAKLEKLSEKFGVEFVLSLSLDESELPESAKSKVVISL